MPIDTTASFIIGFMGGMVTTNCIYSYLCYKKRKKNSDRKKRLIMQLVMFRIDVLESDSKLWALFVKKDKTPDEKSEICNRLEQFFQLKGDM